MITLELNGKEYKLPTAFSEMNIETYSKVVAIDNDLEDAEKYIKIISSITGIEEEIVRKIKVEQMKLIQDKIQFMFNSDKMALVDRFTIDGKKYGFNYDLDQISFGEFIDLEEFSKPNEVNNNLHILMAILYRPIKEKRSLFYFFKKNKDYSVIDYDSENVMKRAELFKHKLTMDKVLGSLLFFSILSTTTILNSQDYLQNNQKKNLKKQMNQMILEMNNQVG